MRMFEHVYAIGDMNVRTGTESDAEAGNSEVKEVGRASQDKVINDESERLIRICKELGLSILNGWVSGYREGRVTFISGKGEHMGSVLNLVLAVDRGEGWSNVKLKVEERTESDHLPIGL